MRRCFSKVQKQNLEFQSPMKNLLQRFYRRSFSNQGHLKILVILKHQFISSLSSRKTEFSTDKIPNTLKPKGMKENNSSIDLFQAVAVQI